MGGCYNWRWRRRAPRPKLTPRKPNYGVNVTTPNIVLRAVELPSSSHPRVLAPFPAPSRATHSRKVWSSQRRANSARGLRSTSSTDSVTSFFNASCLLAAYRSVSSAGASPVQAEKSATRLLVPGRATGSRIRDEVGHGAPDPFGDDLVRICEQDARV